MDVFPERAATTDVATNVLVYRALIVDPDAHERALLRACLAMAPAIGSILERATVASALEVVKSEAIDLVVTRYEAPTTPALIEQLPFSARPTGDEASASRRLHCPLLACISWNRWEHGTLRRHRPDPERVARQIEDILASQAPQPVIVSAHDWTGPPQSLPATTEGHGFGVKDKRFVP
jgi:hypothetical protein